MTIPVESSISAFVDSFGGERVEHLMPNANPPGQADYVFRKQGAVLELKCLEQNLFSSAYADKLAVLVRKWIGQGLIPRGDDVTIGLRTVPGPCQPGRLCMRRETNQG